MNLANVLFLAANTARSQAYAQALENSGITIGTCVIFDSDVDGLLGKPVAELGQNHENSNIFMPDLSIPLEDSCGRISGDVRKIAAGNINDPSIFDVVDAARHHLKLIIFSGFGGQIVKSDLLRRGPSFLHIHSGWLPEYRGSTTIYYSILNERQCGVSAILLTPKIDQGPILERRWYPLPPPGDIDYLYDNAIRADCLVNFLRHRLNNPGGDVIEQSSDEGSTYYVIHPVLKNVALLSLEKIEQA